MPYPRHKRDELTQADKEMIQTCLNCRRLVCKESRHCDYGKKYAGSNPATLVQHHAGFADRARAVNVGIKDVAAAVDRYMTKHNIKPYEDLAL